MGDRFRPTNRTEYKWYLFIFHVKRTNFEQQFCFLIKYIILLIFIKIEENFEKFTISITVTETNDIRTKNFVCKKANELAYLVHR